MIVSAYPAEEEREQAMRIAIVGAGQGGSAVMNVLHADPDIQLVGIVDVNPGAWHSNWRCWMWNA